MCSWHPVLSKATFDINDSVFVNPFVAWGRKRNRNSNSGGRGGSLPRCKSFCLVETQEHPGRCSMETREHPGRPSFVFLCSWSRSQVGKLEMTDRESILSVALGSLVCRRGSADFLLVAEKAAQAPFPCFYGFFSCTQAFVLKLSCVWWKSFIGSSTDEVSDRVSICFLCNRMRIVTLPFSLNFVFRYYSRWNFFLAFLSEIKKVNDLSDKLHGGPILSFKKIESSQRADNLSGWILHDLGYKHPNTQRPEYGYAS